jgi:hypothetical protein
MGPSVHSVHSTTLALATTPVAPCSSSGCEPDASSTVVDLATGERAVHAAVRAGLLAPPGTITLVRATPGAGKTFAVHQALTDRPREAVVFAPTHSLLDEYKLGLPLNLVRVRRGVTATRIDGKIACVQHAVVTECARIGLDPVQNVCTSCPQRAAYTVKGTACPAYLDATAAPSGTLIDLRANTRASDILQNVMWTRDDPQTWPIIVVDELPPLVRTLSLGSDLGGIATLLTAARPGVQAKLGPIVIGALRALADGGFQKATLRELLLTIYKDPGAVEAMLTECRRAASSYAYAADGEHAVADAVGKHEGLDLGEAMAIIELLREASFMPDRTVATVSPKTDKVTLCARAPFARVAGTWLRRGGRVVVLDGTADPKDLRSLGIASSKQTGGGKSVMHVVNVDVEDARGASRIVPVHG